MLVESKIAADIKSAFELVMLEEEDRDKAINLLSASLANVIVNAIKSSTVIYEGGLTSPSGPVTGIFNSTIK